MRMTALGEYSPKFGVLKEGHAGSANTHNYGTSQYFLRSVTFVM
jgi:hypothetical protein